MQRIHVKYGVLNIWNVFAEFEYVADLRGIFGYLNKCESENKENVGKSVSAALEDNGTLIFFLLQKNISCVLYPFFYGFHYFMQ